MNTCLVGTAAVVVALLLATPSGWSQAPAVQGSSANTAGPPRVRDAERVHDPSTILTWKGLRYCFSTGPGIALMREDASGKWLREGRVFAEGKFPAWHAELVPGNRGHLWAPDVIRVGDKLFLYYSVSTFGKNDSAIGLAVSDSLDPASTHWQDHGQVVVSRKSDRFNAIDPAIFRDGDASLWMTFGSFWDGIHLVELDAKTGMRRAPNEPPRRLAWSPEVEAPFLCKRGDYYYLFINWGKCCRGNNSTYEIRVGRSRAVTGPYVDRSGIDLRERGGTMVLTSNERWIGPGHASLHEHKGREWLVHHYYDRQAEGRPRLRLVPLEWDAKAWPVVLNE